VAKGGNFLLGVGPDKTGELPPAVYERLEAIGRWMYAFYLKEEGEVFPEILELPTGFVKQVGEVELLGYGGKLEVRLIDGKGVVYLPDTFTFESWGVGVLVFSWI
jgi:hypothetical protein